MEVARKSKTEDERIWESVAIVYFNTAVKIVYKNRKATEEEDVTKVKVDKVDEKIVVEKVFEDVLVRD